MALKPRLKAMAQASLPTPVTETLRAAIRRIRRQRAKLGKRWRAWKAPLLHARLLATHRGARPIRVAFLVSNTASWKVGPVLSRMLEDEDFQTIAVICPVVAGQLSHVADQTAEAVRRYLDMQGFAYVDLTGVDESDAKAELDRLDPHLVVFTNPHRLVPEALHDDLFRQRLSCYVPYSHEVMQYGDDQEQHNQESHNAFWRIFVPHDASRRCYAEARIRGDAGVSVTGFPACEPLMEPATAREPSPWQPQDRAKARVVYAPHWLWRPDIKMATIDTFGDAMMRIADDYREDIQWALRPHPMLRPKLMEDPAWGPARTQAFFDFWEHSEFSQIHEDDYVPLFRTSDALIHDSGSFLAEYLYLRKPVMYLMTEETGDKYFNSFGRAAITACEVGRSADEIRRFLDDLLAGQSAPVGHSAFFRQEIAPHLETPPSQKICDEIKRAVT
ncbi:CDP-glycerol glycerophosphotransferase family protein [Roseovarius sp. D22-M7]|uniref:CDP-glycerol glycerophosphotransferase family protein n=1 Tax=Roseovarius sp. D22-M7 TaxID=3127116 RepID=UPI0030104AF6